MFTCVISLILNVIDIWIDLWNKMMFAKKNENEMFISCLLQLLYHNLLHICKYNDTYI